MCLQMNRERLMKMASAVRTGGKGTVRRCAILALTEMYLGILIRQLISIYLYFELAMSNKLFGKESNSRTATWGLLCHICWFQCQQVLAEAGMNRRCLSGS